MREFEKAHPFALEHLRAGEFAIQQQERYGFFATAADQVIEQTVNRDNKISVLALETAYHAPNSALALFVKMIRRP